MWSILMLKSLNCLFGNFLLSILITLIMIYFCLYKILFGGKMKNVWNFDLMSTSLVFLSSMMVLFCFLSNQNYIMKFLLFTLTLFFFTKKVILFYIFFELSVIPAFFLIFSRGKNPERMFALKFLMLYTMMGSFPFMYFVLKNYSLLYKMKTMFLENKMYNFKMLKTFSVVLLVLAFFIKLPLFGLHSWLPKAHVEAPTQGSMILAALLLKMGSYGFYRFSMSEFSGPGSKMLVGWMIMSLMLVSFFCFRISDMKMLVAFSSVSHMLMMAFSWVFLSWKSLYFSLFLGVSHGYISSGLFFIMGKIYENSNSRSIFFNSGLNKLFSSLKVFWFLLLVGKCSAPTSLSLFSEIFLFKHMVTKTFSNMSMVCFVFFCGLYCIYLYMLSFHGDLQKVVSFSKTHLKNKLMSFLHMIYSFLFVFFLVSFF